MGTPRGNAGDDGTKDTASRPGRPLEILSAIRLGAPASGAATTTDRGAWKNVGGYALSLFAASNAATL
jgi:hypothetical protein